MKKQRLVVVLPKWTTGSNQVWLTALMGDVAKVFKNLQKNFQSDE